MCYRLLIEAKKSRSSSRQSKEAVPEETNESVFGIFLREAGVTLKHGGTPNEIAVDQVIFQKRVQKQLQKSPRYPGIVQEFIAGLESHIEDADRFRNSLLPCSISAPQRFICLFLFSTLQTLIINTLLEKLPEFMLDGTSDGGLSIPRIIINQLKWLDRIVDSKELATKLMELVSVAPVDVQRDIITSLPEILEDSQHNDIAQELNSLLQQNTQLTVPILDVLSSLNLSSSILAEVRSAVMSTLAAVQLEDLPVVVKFILHSVSASDAYEVVSNLRKKLELELCVLPPGLQASQSHIMSKGKTVSTNSPATGRQDSVTLTLDGIKTAVRFQKTISEAWIKVIDLLVLFILHTTNANQSRRAAERVLKAKVRNGQIQESLLQKTFRDYVMRGYFPSILALAQCLLRSPDPSVVPFGGHMYRHSFTVFDSYCQQEVVGSLVTHVCSGVGGEVDMALELLCGLVTEKPSEMALYAVFVKGVLDYMDNLTPQQIRKLFNLLSTLAFGQQQGSHIQDDMHIVVRKQLSSTVPKYKRIGIIGAVMIIGSMGALSCQVCGLYKCSCVSLQLTALLELVQSSSQSSAEATALYYDELANLVLTSTLDPQVQVRLKQTLMSFLFYPQVIFTSARTVNALKFKKKRLSEIYSSQGGIAINLLPLLASDFQNKGEQQSQTTKRASPLCLSPFFRLLRLCEEKQHQGDLEEIDALLGCPLVLTDMDVGEKVEALSKAEREFFCTLLFHSINWFREVVNAFCRQKDTEMKMKVMTRLQNITYLQTQLEKALAGVLYDLNMGINTSIYFSDGTGKKRKAPGKNSSESSSQLEEATEADETQQEKEKEKEKEKETRPGISLTSYRQFFRELDMEVLSVLQCGLISCSLLDSELHTKVREEVLLGPAELVFLLEDMFRKVEFSLIAAPAKRTPFLKGKMDRSAGFSHLQQRSPKDIASCSVQLLPALCSHLENCHNHFQTVLSENNGVVDGPATDVQEHQLMTTAYQLLLQVLNTTFSWSGFSQPGQRSLLKKALGVLAGRLKEGASLARRFLSQEWVTPSGEKERGTKFNETLHTVLSIYLEHVDDVLKAVEEIAGEGIPELLNAAKDESSTSWPTLNSCCYIKIVQGHSHTCLYWSGLSEVHPFISLSYFFLQVFDSRLVVNVCLKYGRLFLESFLKLGMPLLDYSFKRHKEDVQSLLKTFQLSTRQLHHMCGHSKINQDTSLTNHVPALKKSLELFIYRVKAMLTLNNCQEAFWMGNLKNRNLKGEEILSQRSQGKSNQVYRDPTESSRSKHL
uniref:FA complementation group D2 n=1 Tax=Sphaeramia orbicularis TaxID=375764 RepID=A0A673AP68_9TELE